MTRPLTIPPIAGLWIVTVASSLLACATPVGRTLGPDEKTIAFRSYTVGVPGTSWGSTVDTELEQVKFETVKTDYFGSGKRSTSLLTVRRIDFTDPKAADAEEALARAYLAGEERNMIERGVKPKLYELKDVKTGERTIGGKKVHYMTYETRSMTQEYRLDCESVVYLYFTPDFRGRRAFYGFFGTDCCPAGRPPQLASEIGALDELVQSFAIRGPPPESAPDQAGR